MNGIAGGAMALLVAIAALIAGMAAILSDREEEPLYCGVDFVLPEVGDPENQDSEAANDLVVISESLTLQPIQVQNARLIIGIGQALGQPVDAIRAAVDRSLSTSTFLNTAPNGLMGLDPVLFVTVDVLDKGAAINHVYESVLSDPPPMPDESSQWHLEVTAILETWLISANPTGCEPGGSIGGDVVGDADVVDVQGITVHRSIASQLNAMLTAARQDGITLNGWGWRSHQRQHELRLINGCPNDGSAFHLDGEDPSQWAPASACRVPTARPGFSRHESGLAVDFTYRGSTIRSRTSPAFRWLDATAAQYGFYNLPSEPWHWSVDGR